MISQQHLDDLAIEAVGNQLTFFERVRQGAVSGRFARVTYADRRRLKLLIMGNDQHEYSFRIIAGYKANRADYRLVDGMANLGQVLRAVFSRVAQWRSIALEQTAFNGNDQQIGIFDSLSASMAEVGEETAMSVRAFKCNDRTRLDENHRIALMARLSQWIEQWSAQLLHLVVNLKLPSTGETLQPLMLAISHCQHLRRLDIFGLHFLHSTAALHPMLALLPQLTTLRLNPYHFRTLNYGPLSRSICLTDHWLETFVQMPFRPLLSRMKLFVLLLSTSYLPLTAEHLLAVIAMAASMQSPVRIAVGEHFRSPAAPPVPGWSGDSTLNLVLADWLPLARDKKMGINLYTKRRQLLTVDQFLSAIVALPSALCKGLLTPTIASVRAGQEPLSFCYNGGGKVLVWQGADMANNHDDAYSDNYYELDWLFGGGCHQDQENRSAIEDLHSVAKDLLSMVLIIIGLILLLYSPFILLLVFSPFF